MKSAKIIVACPEESRSSILISQLQELEYPVIGAAKIGIEAVTLCEMLTPDLIIFDINMPSLNDFQAAKIIKECNQIPVIIISEYFNNIIIEAATQAGVLSFLIKPLKMQDLASAIEVALKNHSAYCQALKELHQLRQIYRDALP